MDWKGHICSGIWMNSVIALTGVTAGNRHLIICWSVVYGRLIGLWLSFVYNHFFVYNIQPGFTIDYRNGDVYSDNPLSLSGKRLGYNIYVIDTDAKRFHKESCMCICEIKSKMYFVGEKQILEEEYSKCEICIS